MNSTEKARQMAEVMQAFADGKEIECRCRNFPEDWSPILAPVWNWPACEYRIKPKPVEPTYRPWTFDEVPVGKIVRSKGGFVEAMITRKTKHEENRKGEDGRTVVNPDSARVDLGTVQNRTPVNLLASYVMAEDGSPCGIKVD